ncbi:MAG TPA: carboxypeptidase-like regulatory domain-containing protein [Actinomycetota bacterium]|nr:carboxypeptidase-like regulatory domain-containing protein [Actinomycetota bacterium]
MPIHPNTAVALVIAGLCLAAVGLLRLTGPWLSRMPAVIAGIAVGLGAAVAASGVVASRPAVPAIQLTERATPAPAPLAALQGTVRTAAGAPVAATKVVLRRFVRTEPNGQAEATTGPAGEFAFPGLEASPSAAYRVVTDFSGTTFGSDVIVLPPVGEPDRVDLVVAETTPDAAALSVQVDSTVLFGDAKGVQVLQVLGVRNSGDRAFTGGLRLPLLPEAHSFQPRKGIDRTTLTFDHDGLMTTAPVLPGETEIVYMYAVPAPTKPLRLERSVSLPTSRLELLWTGELDVRSPGLRPEGPVRVGGEAGGRRFSRMRKSGVNADEGIRATVRAGAGRDRLRPAAVAGGVAVAIGVLLFPLLRRRRGTQTGLGPEPA